MESRYVERDADAMVARYADDGVTRDVALRVYTTRLLGQDPRLVLHGGGNTSVKTVVPDLAGAETQVLCVKGTGWDMGTMEPAGMPAVRLAPLLKLRERAAVADEEMVRFQRANLIDPMAPNPSVETLLHAFVPHAFVDHTHATAILSLTDQPDGEDICAALFDGRMGIVPYIMPGFALAKKSAEVFEANPQAEGLILHKHGIFTFGAGAQTRNVGSAGGLGEKLAPYFLARSDLGQIAPLVGFAAIGHQSRPTHAFADLERVRQLEVDAFFLLPDHALHRSGAAAAVFLRPVQAGPAAIRLLLLPALRDLDDVLIAQLDAPERRLRELGLQLLRRVGVDPLAALAAEGGFLRGIIEVHGDLVLS